MLDTVGSILLRFGVGRIWLVFPPPERIPSDEFLVGPSLLHIVVKGVQSIERDGSVLGEAFALGLIEMGKSVGYSQHVAVDSTHLLVRLGREPLVSECVRGHFSWRTKGRLDVDIGGVRLCTSSALSFPTLYWFLLGARLHVKC